ncbi:MAG: right-handed parallel beta-helix repeat-containing protein, partial [Planctomycetota bacterium]|nr:right-handed parallel beta-helix repeat-containing protein [Planctomycetota bacterium]
MKKLAASFVCLLLAITCQAKIIYVDDDAAGLNDGSSWQHAYNCLQDALANANSASKPIEIRVAQGIYKPDRNSVHPDGNGDRSASFQLINGVTLKGGYAGPRMSLSGADPNARDVDAYETILSGDLNGDDIDVNDPCDLPRAPNWDDNSSTVVSGSKTDRTAILDGFTITGGYWFIFCFGPWPPPCPGGGAGMYNYSGSPTVISCTFRSNATINQAGGGLCNWNGSNPSLLNCRFIKNYAVAGGGMCNSTSSPKLTNCQFQNNYGSSRGGGVDNSLNSSPILRNCSFSRNSTSQNYVGTQHGGGMYNRGNPTLIDCTFSNNSTSSSGGGMFNSEGSSSMLDNCEFSGNSASFSGGGMYNSSESATRLSNCKFRRNTAGGAGGGLLNRYNSKLALANCTFTSNAAGSQGGGMAAGNSTLVNCIFAGNSATRGGGIYDSNSTLTNCTFTKNLAKEMGGGLWFFRSYNPPATLANCILWGNTPGEVYVQYGSPVITYSDVQGGWSGEGNTDKDPCFADPGYWDPNGTPADANDAYFGEPVCEIIVAGDINGDCKVNLIDFAFMALHWQEDNTSEPPGQATNPSPHDGATGVSTNTDLVWTAGANTVSHDIYFGTDKTAITNADRRSSEYEGNRTATGFDPGQLTVDTTYYWRIDEVGYGCTTTGRVWGFSTYRPGPPGPQPPPPPKGRTCFPADTPVWVDGTLVEISKVVSGQMVGKVNCLATTASLEQIEA